MARDPGDEHPRRTVPLVPRRPARGQDAGLAPDIDVHSLTGAFAVDALDDLERVRFEQHLATCADCVAEVRSFTETTARLGGAESIAAPAHLRDAVLAQVRTTRQLSPGPAQGAPAALAGSRRTTTRTRWLSVAAVAALVASAGLGGLALDAERDADRLEQVTAAVTDVLSDPDRQVMETDFAGGHATVMVSGAEVVLVGNGIEAPPSDAAYVLWMLDAEGKPRPAGVLERADDGSVLAHTTGYRAGETMAVTVEENPDTQLPHGEMVMTTASA